MEPSSRGLVSHGNIYHNKTIEKHMLKKTREGRILPWSSNLWPLPLTLKCFWMKNNESKGPYS